MENIYELEKRKRELEEQLEKLAIQETVTRPWDRGIQDSHNTTEYTYTVYTDPQKASIIKYQIKELESKCKKRRNSV